MTSNSQAGLAKTPVKTLANVATDAQFWVPSLVLIAGLMLLRWIS